jgi:hypothetical protein
MGSIQLGYGADDAIAPGRFDYYDAATGTLVSGDTINLQTSNLLVVAAAAIAALTVVLPINPPDGCVAELNAVNYGVTALTLNANTGDKVVNAPTALVAATPVRLKYSLNGDVTKGVNARTWFRVQ